MDFTERLSLPEKGNKYYNRKVSGGYSPCILGKPTVSGLDTLGNCVGWTVGRFNEIGGYKCCKYLGSRNAENFIELAQSQGLKISQAPSLGAVMVWQKGATLSGTDGAGHVCIVERVVSATEVVTSESGYNSVVFYSKTRKKGTGNWGQSAEYRFLGFIVNPAIDAGAGAAQPGASTPTVPTVVQPKEVIATGVAYCFSKSLAGTYTVTAGSGLNIRNAAGTDKKILVTIPKGAQVQCYGYYSNHGGVKWLYVQFTYSGTKYTAFASAAYLKKT